MILTGSEIVKSMQVGEIEITPFDPDGIRPNSYDWRLGNTLLVSRGPLDAALQPEWDRTILGPEGYVLMPGVLYLGETLERTASDIYSQFLNGDVATGSLGIWVHVSAPLGHVGHAIKWTLEIRVVRPVRVYAGMRFGRLVFIVNSGPGAEPAFEGAKYRHSVGVEGSKLYEEFGR